MSDKVLKCLSCGREFVWTQGAQNFFAKMNFTEPKRCPDCRAERRERKRAEQVNRG